MASTPPSATRSMRSSAVAATAAGVDRSGRDATASRFRCVAGCTWVSSSARDNDFFGSAVNRAARIMERCPWRAGPALATGRDAGGRSLAGRRHVARLGLGSTPRPVELGACLSVRASAASRGFSGAALAGSDAEQPAATGDVVQSAASASWPTSGSCCIVPRLVTLRRRRRPRQDALVAAGGGRRDGRLPGRRLARRARAACRSAIGAADRRDPCSASRKKRGRPVIEALVKYIR